MSTVPELIWAQAQRSPEAVAVEAAASRLTYAQLLAEAAGVAEHLRQIGVGPGDLAAVALPRDVDLIPTLLGVRLSGAAYLPLDPEHPVDRLNHIIGDSRGSPRCWMDADSAPEPRPVPLLGGRNPRLSAAQWRLWLHQRSAPHSTADNAPVVIRLPGPLDLAALESALTGLLERATPSCARDEPDDSGLPTPVVLPAAPVRLKVADGDPRTILAEELARPSISPQGRRSASAWCTEPPTRAPSC